MCPDCGPNTSKRRKGLYRAGLESLFSSLSSVKKILFKCSHSSAPPLKEIDEGRADPDKKTGDQESRETVSRVSPAAASLRLRSRVEPGSATPATTTAKEQATLP
jgi:hypothetical protein